MRAWSVGIVLAACMAAVAGAPVGVLLYAPLLLGAAHVAGDVVVLLVDPAVPVARPTLVAVALLTLGSWALYAMGGLGAADLALAVGAVATGVWSGAGPRRAWLMAPVVLLAAAVWWSPAGVRLGMAHAHNLVGVAALLVWSRGARWAWGLVAGVGLVSAAIFAGALDGPLQALADAAPIVAGLAPGLGETLARRVTGTYALLQLVHYAVWLGWAPSLRPGGWRWLAAAMAVVTLPTLGLLVWGADDPAAARAAYLSAAGFHGWLELAVLAHQAAGGARAAR